MAEIHIEDFYKDAAMTLIRLYSVFPRKASVFVEDIAGPDQPDEYGLHCPRHSACFGTMLWLADEGFLRYEDTIRQDAIDQATLTQRAFILLSRHTLDPELLALAAPVDGLPASVAADRLTHVNVIRHVLKTGTSSQLSYVLQKILFDE